MSQIYVLPLHRNLNNDGFIFLKDSMPIMLFSWTAKSLQIFFIIVEPEL